MPVPELAPGQLLVRNAFMSVDPSISVIVDANFDSTIDSPKRLAPLLDAAR